MTKFEEAVRMSCLEWAADLPEACEFSLSADSKKYFKKLLERMDTGAYRRVSKRTLRFVLIAAIIAVLLAAVTIGAAVGQQSFQIIPDGDMARYVVINPSEPLDASDLIVDYTAPDFYVADIVYDAENKICGYEYLSANDSAYSILRTESNGYSYFDNDNDFYCVEHNNIKFTYFESDEGYLGLIWNYGGYIYSIAGDISLDTAFDVADSLNY